MQEVSINFLAVLLAGLSNMVVGFVWYSPMLFEKPWMKLAGLTKEKIESSKKDMPKIMLTSLGAALLMSYCLRYSIVYGGSYNNISGVGLGLMTGFFSWLGFIMPVQLMNVLFERQPFKLFLIHTGYHLVAILAMGMILSIL